MKIRTIFSIIILTLLLLISIFAPFLAPYNPDDVSIDERLQTPNNKHFLGTDELGRDVFSRVLFGGRASMLLAFLASLISMIIGIIIGSIAGHFKGIVDNIYLIITNIFMGLPGICLMIAIVALMGPGIMSLIIALSISSWANFSRYVRAEIIRIEKEGFIEALKLTGIRGFRLYAFHILPNIFSTLSVLFSNRLGGIVLSISSLSFVGLGIQPPTADWSVILANSRNYISVQPALVISPMICIIAFVYSIYGLGDFARDKIDRREITIE